MQPNTADHASGRVMDGWRTNAGVRAIATHPQVLELLQRLYGRTPIPFQTLNFYNGTEQDTHSDTIHFSCFPARFMCGVWVALEDITLRQGPLHYYPGSQTMPEFDYEDFGIKVVEGAPGAANADVSRAYREYELLLHATVREAGHPYHELAIKKGSFLIWSSNLLHGGARRLDTALSRRSQVTHYFFEDVLSVTPMFSRRFCREYFVRDLVDIRTGQPVPATINGRELAFAHTEHLRRTVGFADEMFDERLAASYLKRYPDVKVSAKGTLEGAYSHYLRNGFAEGRTFFASPSREDWLDLREEMNR